MKELIKPFKRIVGRRFFPRSSPLLTFTLVVLIMSECGPCFGADWSCDIDVSPDSATTTRDSAVYIRLSDNDGEWAWDRFRTMRILESPGHGDIVGECTRGQGMYCSVLYTPQDGYVGTDTFVYELCISCLVGVTQLERFFEDFCESATVTVTIIGVNAVDDSAMTVQDTPVSINVLANDVVSGVASPTVTGFTEPASGSVTDDGGGVLTYTPDDGFLGDDSFTYTITGGQDTDTATVAVTVDIPPDVVTSGDDGGPVPVVNTPPDAVDDSATTDRITSVAIDVLANDSDPDGDPLTIDGFSAPSGGSVTDNGDGTLTYEPDGTFWGEDSFTYTISDGQGGTDTATVTIQVAYVPYITTEIIDVFDCVYIGSHQFEWYTVEITYADGIAQSSTVLSGPHRGYWVPGCPPDPGEPPGPDEGDPCDDAFCGNGVCEPDCGETIDTCDDDCSP